MGYRILREELKVGRCRRFTQVRERISCSTVHSRFCQFSNLYRAFIIIELTYNRFLSSDPLLIMDSDPATGFPSHTELKKLSMEDLGNEHRRLLARAVDNVLSTDIAEVTYSQIVDGLPISDVEEDQYSGSVSDLHPIHTMHKELCVGAIDIARRFRDTFVLNTLQFNSRVRTALGGLKGEQWQPHLTE